MKKPTALIILLLLCVFSCTPTVNVDKEKEAIKATIEEEKKAYFARDAAGMGETWVQDSTSRKIWFSANGLTEVDGWEMVNADNKKGTQSEMWDNVKDLKVDFSDYEFNIYGKTALVFCTTSWNGLYNGKPLTVKQKRILHFLKANGKWKYNLMTIYRIPDGNAEENKKTSAIYHELNPDNIDKILTEDFIGRNEQDRFTWNRENHRNYLSSGVYKRDSIFQQIAEGNWVATRFIREADYRGKRVKFEAMHFKRFEDGKIAEIWEYGDSQQVE
jgi:ketosteroid isomerase-like protein